MSAVVNLAGAVVATQLLHTTVANTIGGLVAVRVSLPLIIAALTGAIAWNLVTWRAGLPSSSSHALIGGLIGMAVGAYGLNAVKWPKVYPVIVALVTSPVVGFIAAFVLMTVV